MTLIQHTSALLIFALMSTATGAPDRAAADDAGAATRDTTPGEVWIERLERPERIPGLRIEDVVASLNLQPGDVVADIGAGTGAFSIPFAQAVAPTGKVLAQDIWPVLLDHIAEKAEQAGVDNVRVVLGEGDDPGLPAGAVDVAFFHDVLHNARDRRDYLEKVARSLKPGGRIAVVEQEFDDPIAKRWDVPEDRIRPEQLDRWMTEIGFVQVDSFDLFQGENNPPGAKMPERWFVVYARGAK